MRAPIAIGGLAVCAAADDPVSPYQETAVNRVRATMRDSNAKIENVVFHPVPGPGLEGRSYVCGYARSSTDNNARSESSSTTSVSITYCSSNNSVTLTTWRPPHHYAIRLLYRWIDLTCQTVKLASRQIDENQAMDALANFTA
jgi:hypothetical protein